MVSDSFSPWQRYKAVIVATIIAIILTACVVDQLRILPIGVDSDDDDVRVVSPVKAHLVDGSTVVFQQGIWVKDGKVIGPGERYDVTLRDRTTVSAVSVDDIAAMETFYTDVDEVASSLATGAVITVGATAGIILFKAIFGSCPTTYTLEDGEAVLEAESFSYSVVPRLETRDIDRLGIENADGEIVLEVRNEALETHYINQLELVEVSHNPAQRAWPDPDGGLVLAGEPVLPLSALDTQGDDISSLLGKAEGVAWQATEQRLAQLTPDSLNDHIDLSFPVTPGQTDIALLMRFRNSLLTTVLFYDVILKGLGFEALDWMGDQALSLDMLKSALWYDKHMGMRVSVWERGRYQEVAHIKDQGPIAWKEIAVPLPVSDANARSRELKVRLTFIADNWRLDWAGAAPVEAVEGKRIPVKAVADSSHNQEQQVRVTGLLAEADKNYLVTRPGEKVQLHFDVGAADGGQRRTYFLAAQGYYVEWMRKDWLTPSPVTRDAATASDMAMWDAIQLWRDRRSSYRKQFENTRIAAR